VRLSVLYQSFSFLLIATAIAFSCNNKKPHEMPLAIQTDTLSLYKKSNPGIFDVVHEKGEAYFVFYRHQENALAFVNLSTGMEESEKRIPLPAVKEEGPLQSFDYVSRDSVFLIHEFSIDILSADSGNLFSQTINTPESDDWPPVIYGNFLDVFPLHYDLVYQTLYIRQHCGPCGTDTSFYRTNIMASYDVKNRGTIQDIGIPYPVKYKKAYYGDALSAFREFKGDSILLSFQADDKIYIFDRKSRKLTCVDGKSRFEEKSIVPLDFKYHTNLNVRGDHLTVNPLYLKILYDPYRHLFYRLFLKGMPLKSKDGTYNTFFDKDLILMVFDEKLEKLNEYNLGTSYNWYYSFVAEKGLYLKKRNVKDEEVQEFIFDIIRYHH
jgi:hypothetical protein